MKLGERHRDPPRPCQIGSERLGGRETRTQLARSGDERGKIIARVRLDRKRGAKRSREGLGLGLDDLFALFSAPRSLSGV
jgi:hypothetical protein